MNDPWHVEVVPLPAHDGWLLRCLERPDVAVRLSTLDDMGGRIARAIAASVGHHASSMVRSMASGVAWSGSIAPR